MGDDRRRVVDDDGRRVVDDNGRRVVDDGRRVQRMVACVYMIGLWGLG